MKLFLSTRHCHFIAVTVSLSPYHCHPFTIMGMCLSPFHCHGCLCLSVTAAPSVSWCLCHDVTVVLSFSRCLCHGVTVTPSLSRFLRHSITVSLSLSRGVSVIPIAIALSSCGIFVIVSQSPCRCRPVIVSPFHCHEVCLSPFYCHGMCLLSLSLSPCHCNGISIMDVMCVTVTPSLLWSLCHYVLVIVSLPSCHGL